MSEMVRYVLIIVLLLVIRTNPVHAQTVHTDKVISQITYSENLELIAFSDEKEIQIRSTNDLSLLGTIPFTPQTRGSVQWLKFDPRDNNKLWIRFGKFTDLDQKMPFFEYPEDSLFCYDYINKQRVADLAGNLMLAIHRNGVDHVGAVNNFYSYTDENGIIRHGAQPGFGVVLKDAKEIPLEKVVRSISLDTIRKQILLVNYIDYTNAEFQYQLETRNASTFELITQSEFTTLPSEEPIFSDDGNFILFRSVEGRESIISAFSLENLKPVELVEVTNTKGLLHDHLLLEVKDNNLNARNLTDNTLKWTLWSNLTELFSISGGLLLPNNQLIVFGTTTRLTKNYLYSSGAIQKINLKDLGVFVEIEKTKGIEVKFTPSKLRVSDNSSQAEKVFVKNGSKLLYAQKEGLLEIWSLNSKMKLYEVRLEKVSKIFPNWNDSSILIFEEYRKGSGFSDFKLSLLDLKTGLSNFRIVRQDQEDIDFSFNSFCECLQVKSAVNKWICSDESKTLWKVDGTLLEMSPILHFGKKDQDHNRGVASISELPASDLMLVRITHISEQEINAFNPREITDSLILFNPTTLSVKRILTKQDDVFPISEQHYILIEENTLTVNNWMSGALKSKIDLKEWKPKKVEVNQEFAVVFCESEKTGEGRAYRIEREAPFKLDTIKLNPSYGFFIPMKHEIIGLYNGEITSYNKELAYWGAWNKKIESMAGDQVFQFLGNGKLMLGNSKIIDFATLEVGRTIENLTEEIEFLALPTHLNAIALKGEWAGKIMYVRTVNYVDQGEKPYAQFVIAHERNYTKIYWESKKIILKNEEYFFPSKVSISSSGKYAGIVSSMETSESRGVFIIDLSSKNMYTYPVKTYGSIHFGYDDKYAMVSGSTSTSVDKWVEWVVDLSNGKRIENPDFDKNLLRDTTLLKVEFQHQNVTLSKFVNGEYKILKEFYAREYLRSAYYSKSNDRILAGSANGTLFVWSNDNSSPLMQIAAGVTPIDDIREENEHILVTLESGELIIYRKKDMKELARIIAQKKDVNEYEFAWFTPEGYYKAPKSELSNYHFVYNGQAFPLLNFEVYLNRPDYILEKLAYADESLITAYKEVYNRRLKRYGLKETGLIDFEQLPKIEIINKEHILQSPSVDSVELIISVLSSEKLSNLQAQVNGIPISSIEAIPINLDNLHDIKLKVPIGAENNLITVSAVTVSGKESIPDQISVFGKKSKTAKILYIGIGVSNYKDTSMNLVFADDDVRRMSRYLKANNGDKADTLTLTNEHATKENILAIKSKLMKTSIDDIVVLSFSGHGLLDSLGNFYFANHDMNFTNPKGKGVSFEQLQFLLDDIPARRKLLLLDACHSGEVDQINTSIQSTSKLNKEDGSKGGDVEVTNLNLTKQNSFQLMLNNFGDFSTNNGAFVISAAGGEEVAYETDEFGGVFTHSVINALDDLARDYRSKAFSVSELQKLIYSNVQTFGKGRQTPTTRSQNMIWDWNFELYE